MAELKVLSELKATVWKLEVSPGQAVSEGQDLAILECMKTEIPVVSPRAGTVADIRVAEGDVVDERQVLLVLTT